MFIVGRDLYALLQRMLKLPQLQHGCAVLYIPAELTIFRSFSMLAEC